MHGLGTVQYTLAREACRDGTRNAIVFASVDDCQMGKEVGGQNGGLCAVGRAVAEREGACGYVAGGEYIVEYAD